MKIFIFYFFLLLLWKNIESVEQNQMNSLSKSKIQEKRSIIPGYSSALFLQGNYSPRQDNYDIYNSRRTMSSFYTNPTNVVGLTEYRNSYGQPNFYNGLNGYNGRYISNYRNGYYYPLNYDRTNYLQSTDNLGYLYSPGVSGGYY